MLELRPVPFDHPDAVAMIDAAQRMEVERYGSADRTPVDPADFTPPRGYFVVGYLDGRAVASGGWRARRSGEDPGLRDGDAEVKRMYVADGHRRRGFARAVLADLERSAAAAGCRRMVLETGTRQPEAVALYVGAGYVPAPRFGIYRDDPLSLCFAMSLAGRGAEPGK